MTRLAVKIINRARAPEDFLLKFLPRELEISVKLKHENIIQTYEIYDIYPRIYIIMEYAENGDLLDLIKVSTPFLCLIIRTIFRA